VREFIVQGFVTDKAFYFGECRIFNLTNTLRRKTKRLAQTIQDFLIFRHPAGDKNLALAFVQLIQPLLQQAPLVRQFVVGQITVFGIGRVVLQIVQMLAVFTLSHWLV
jgi:hypothetical protein